MVASLVLGAALAAEPVEVLRYDVAFEDTVYGRGPIDGRVYHPADLSGGPYPLVAFMHGWRGSVTHYDVICEALVREGFVVASIDTQGGWVLNVATYALDTLALVAWVEAQSADPTSWLAGAVDGGDLVAMGHSMGGATLGNVVGLEPRVRTIVGFMPYLGGGDGYAGMQAFDGSALFLSGTDDTTSLPFMVEDWFERAENAERSLLLEIGGAGHQAVTEEFADGSLDPDRQLEIVEDLAIAFVRSEVFGEEDRWDALVGATAPPELVTERSSGHLPALWGGVEGEVAVLGVAGRPSGAVTVEAAPTAAFDAPVELGATTLVDGLARVELALGDWRGDLYVRATADGVASRVLSLGAVEPAADPEPPVEAPEPDAEPEPVEDPAASGSDPARAPTSGCATAPFQGALWLAVHGLVTVRWRHGRRRPPRVR